MFLRVLSTKALLLSLGLFAASPVIADEGFRAPTVAPVTQLEAGAPQPAIWLLSDEDTRIWLFGTTHVLPHDFAWRSPDLDAIIERVDELVLETSDEDVLAKQELLGRIMERSEPRSILARIGPEYRLRLQLMIKGSPITLEILDRLETWAAAFLLIGLSSADIFGDPENGGEITGVEEQLTEIFDSAGRPISAVETSLGQIGFLRSISEQGQREFLEALIESSTPVDGEEQDPDAVRDPWVTGDIEALGRECDDEQNFPPELREVLLRRRNLNWVDWLVDRMERPGDILFAVGACHLAGSVSVQRMLADRGFSTRRVH